MIEKDTDRAHGGGPDNGAIVAAAIELGERYGWDNVRLSDVAAAVGISLADLLERFRDRDGIADAWFARARAVFCGVPPDSGEVLPKAERMERAMLRWLGALVAHRRVSVEMLLTKMWPFHPHHWLPMIFSLSRHVQLWRDIGGLTARGPRRALEEVVLTWLFLATLAMWATDASEGQERTRAFLHHRLTDADSASRLLFGSSPGDIAGDRGA